MIAANSEKVSSGLSGLDRVLDGGIPSNSVVLLSGGAGAGKTLLGLNFLLDGAEKKQTGYYLSLSEKESELVRACRGIDSLKKIEDYLGKNLKIGHFEIGDRFTLTGFFEILDKYPKLDRLVIDNVNKLLISAKDNREYRTRLSNIISTLKEKVSSTILICETSGSMFDTGNGETFDCDGVIHISFSEFEERPLRTIEVPKMRYTDIEPLVKYTLDISKKGILVSGKKVI